MEDNQQPQYLTAEEASKLSSERLPIFQKECSDKYDKEQEENFKKIMDAIKECSDRGEFSLKWCRDLSGSRFSYNIE